MKTKTMQLDERARQAIASALAASAARRAEQLSASGDADERRTLAEEHAYRVALAARIRATIE